jgi:regulator of protease activity HflC (stomatin/prohibitin superfamily)
MSEEVDAMAAPKQREIIVKSAYRGLRYEDGKFTGVLEPGRYVLPRARPWRRRVPSVNVALVDIRERELTIRNQEILTSDKVAIRVSILTQFKVANPVAALETVESYEDRLYSDVQLAARRSLASMTLEAILTNRNQLSEDILRDVTDAAAAYGITILRADVKDLIFPGNLQQVMNQVLTAQRMSEAQLVEARTRAEKERIEAHARAEAVRVAEEARAGAERLRTQTEVEALERRAAAAEAYANHPALLRLRELETLSELARNANARLYVGFDKHAAPEVAPAD